MKKSISIILCLCIIFSCYLPVHATATSWDTTDQANLQAIKNQLSNTTSGTIKYLISQINSAMYFSSKGVANWLSDLEDDFENYLVINDADVGRKGVAYWAREAVLDLDQLVGTGSGTLLYNVTQLVTNSNNIKTAVDNIYAYLPNIYGILGTIKSHTQSMYTILNVTQPGIYAYAGNIDATTTSYLPKLETLEQALINYRPGDSWNDVTNTSVRLFAHRQLITNNSTGEYIHSNITSSGGTNSGTRKWGLGTPLGNIALILEGLNSNFVNAYTFENGSFDSNRNYVNWQTLISGNRTPTSAINGIYNWLADIQIPVARLAYVYASDFEIDARDKAQTNETSVVNNFIDSNGDGSVPTSSFSSISGLSSGVKSNISTDASPSGIWDIFNSNHGTWFSQETKNQLDTTAASRSVFETPLLDQQIEDIYSIIGGDPER